MNSRSVIAIISLLLAATFSMTLQTRAQRTRGPMVTSLDASIDKDGPHPKSTELKSPAPVTCISGISDDPKSPKPACKIAAPGFDGVLKVGEKVDVKEAGTVTLICTGTGWVRCRARVN
jgi:hypothetical protein